MANPTDKTTGGAVAPVTGKARTEELLRRAQARREMGRGGAKTYARLGQKPPKVKGPGPPPPPPGPEVPSADQALLDAAAQLQYGDQRSALNQQLAQNARFDSGTHDWYAQAVKEINGLKRPVPTFQAPPPPQATGNPIEDQAALSRQNLNSAFSQQQVTNAQSNSDFMDHIAAAMATQEGNTRSATNAQRQALLGQQGNLAANEGAFRTTTLAGLQSDRDKAQLEQAKLATQQLRDQAAIAIQQGNLKIAQDRLAQADRIYQTITLPGAQLTQAKTQAEVDYFNQNGYWPPTGPPKKGKGAAGGDYSRTEGAKNAHHKVIRSVNNAIGSVDQLRSQGYSDAGIIGALQKLHLPTDIIGAALALSHPGGKLSDAQIKQLKLAGLIAAPREWKPKKVKVKVTRPEVTVGYGG